ncbi:3-hydroxyacyl-CoA dehydrogenase family protein [Desulfoferula mesophila]|uniref:3-hydroxybutyryl-CoA dehydrogenase n=1 Tax=Desulfoferula mesophila TaxID=3058419 RepID=A0AAU9ERT9_9BACT|nr:3-hydroxybutyryl-CoA dehydrogenase [Desulfoferula mesophilus]
MGEYDIQNVGVLGAGLMGHGIAQLLAVGGCRVKLFDNDPQVLSDAPRRMRDNLGVFLGLGMITREAIDEALGRVNLASDLAELCEGRDLVIEAVSENLELKRRVFASLEELAAPDCILASNTSAISIGKIAQGLARPGRVVGAHFWNPPHVVPCVEVIRGPQTEDAVLESVYDLLRRVGKRPVRVQKDVPGFVGNRMQHALWREAISLVEEGIASAEDVDEVVRYSFGLRLAFLGPLATADLAGLDLTYDVHKDLFPHLDRSTEPSPLLIRKIERGELGAKSGQGFHSWTPEKLKQVISRRDEVLLKIVREVLS